MICLPLALLLFIPALIATHVINHLQRRDITTVYQPTTIYETIFPSNIEGVFRKTRKVYKHRHEIIKQNRRKFKNDVDVGVDDKPNQQLDPYREYNPGNYRDEYDGDDFNYKVYDAGHCKEGEEGICDENEYEKCNEEEEGCEEYFKDQDFIIRELDFDIYIINIDEYVGTTIASEGYAFHTLLDGTTVTNGKFSSLEPK